MKKIFSFIGIILAITGFLYSGMHIFGTTGKYMEYRGLKSNVKNIFDDTEIRSTVGIHLEKDKENGWEI